MAMTLLYALGLFGLVSYFLHTNAQGGKAKYSPLEAVSVTVFIYFVGQILGGLLAVGVGMALGYDKAAALDWLEKAVNGQFVSILLIEAISVGLLYVFLKRRGATWRSIGLFGRPRLADIAYVLSGYLVYFVLYLAALNVVTKLAPGFNADQQQQIGFDHAQGVQLALVFVSLVVLPPVVEEILMRGFLYSGLRKQMPKVAAIVLTSGLFAVAHLQAGSGAALLWVAAVDTFILSVVLIYLREKTGKLWAPMGLHSLKNLIAFLSLFVFHIAK